MEFYLSLLLLFILTLGGSLIFFIIQKPLHTFINFFLTFSGAFLLGITVLKLFPHVFAMTNNPGLYILGGFLLQLLLESLSKGVEHGHLHIPKPGKLFPWSITLGLAIHAFLEGMPLSHAFDMETGINSALYFGIILHKIPAAFVLFAVMVNYGFPRSKALMVLSIFALMTPLGALISEAFLAGPDMHDSNFSRIILGIVVGAFQIGRAHV